MPLAKRKYQKRVPRKIKHIRRRRPTTNVNRALQPFSSRFITKLKYSEAFVLNVANNWTQTMRLNSLFDPNLTGVGHQPYGFDQLAAIYNRYRVIATSYCINAYSGTSPIRFACIPVNDAPPINNLSELCENPRAYWKLQYPGGDTQYIKGKTSIPSLMGRTKQQYMADDRFQAEVTSSPLEAALLYITGQSMTDSSADFTMTLTMEFTVEFFDPKPIDQS